MSEKGYDLRHARVRAQTKKMEELIRLGVCAFCEEHFESFHDHPIEFETPHWLVSKNDYPYEGAALHLLLVARKHVTTLAELSPEARADFLEVVARIEREWKLPSYAIGMRVGDPELNGSTVEHLHGHVVVGATDEPDHEPVRFKMSSPRRHPA